MERNKFYWSCERLIGTLWQAEKNLKKAVQGWSEAKNTEHVHQEDTAPMSTSSIPYNLFWVALQPSNTLKLSATLFSLLLLLFTNPHTQAEERQGSWNHSTFDLKLPFSREELPDKPHYCMHTSLCAYFPLFLQLEEKSITVQLFYTCSSLILKLSEPCTSVAALSFPTSLSFTYIRSMKIWHENKCLKDIDKAIRKRLKKKHQKLSWEISNRNKQNVSGQSAD